MLADGGPPLFFSLRKPASYYGLKSKGKKMRIIQPLCSKDKIDVGGLWWFLQCSFNQAAFFFFLT
jgi:hypothetical protein